MNFIEWDMNQPSGHRCLDNKCNADLGLTRGEADYPEKVDVTCPSCGKEYHILNVKML